MRSVETLYLIVSPADTLQTVRTQIRPDKVSALICIQTILHFVVFLKQFFEKVDFEKNRRQKSMKNFSGGKEFRTDRDWE